MVVPTNLTWNVFVIKLNGNVIITLFDGNVLNGASSVFVVCAIHFSLRRAFHGNAEAAGTCISGLNCKCIGFIADTAFKTVSVGFDFLRIAASNGSDRER